uniref:Secreted protein n=1 Tax=Strongyloides venezuelensis TaxID=75913 RepID=A0A0K0G5C4_STRVS
MKKIFVTILLLTFLPIITESYRFSLMGYPYQPDTVSPYTNLYSLPTLPLEVKYPSVFSSMYYGLGSNILQNSMKKKQAIKK